MDATDRLEAYFRRDVTTSSDPTTLLALQKAPPMDPDDALRATVLRRMELRLMGHDVAASPSSPARVIAGAEASGHRALAAVAPDEGGGGRSDVARAVGGAEAETRAATSRARAADAVLRRLVAEIRDEDGVGGGAVDGSDAEWTPDGTRWEETPKFLAESSSASARAIREKYPELWSERALGE